jgi:hypothetical protein
MSLVSPIFLLPLSVFFAGDWFFAFFGSFFTAIYFSSTGLGFVRPAPGADVSDHANRTSLPTNQKRPTVLISLVLPIFFTPFIVFFVALGAVFFLVAMIASYLA